MNSKRVLRLFVLSSIAAAIFAILSGCELLVKADLGLVDAGPDAPCAVCLDDADMVVTDDAGNPEIVPRDTSTDADTSDADAGASDASDASGQ